MTRAFRIGQIVPSSNTTMETEVPELLRRRAAAGDVSFTFHSSRMRMRKVTKEELACMDGESERCAVELADARCDVLGYACLVAIMARGSRYHLQSEQRLGAVAEAAGGPAPIVTSAGALVGCLHDLGARRVSIITPYMRPLTDMVVDYIEGEGIGVQASIALEIPDNLEVGRRDASLLLEDIDRLDVDGVDAVVLSACVQMPSLSVIQRVEDRLGLPVTSASIATARKMLEALGISTGIADAGAALAGR